VNPRLALITAVSALVHGGLCAALSVGTTAREPLVLVMTDDGAPSKSPAPAGLSESRPAETRSRAATRPASDDGDRGRSAERRPGIASGGAGEGGAQPKPARPNILISESKSESVETLPAPPMDAGPPPALPTDTASPLTPVGPPVQPPPPWTPAQVPSEPAVMDPPAPSVSPPPVSEPPRSAPEMMASSPVGQELARPTRPPEGLTSSPAGPTAAPVGPRGSQGEPAPPEPAGAGSSRQPFATNPDGSGGDPAAAGKTRAGTGADAASPAWTGDAPEGDGLGGRDGSRWGAGAGADPVARGTGSGEEDSAPSAAYDEYLRVLRRQIHELLVYPTAARRRGISGTVLVELTVKPTGEIERATLARSSAHPALDAAALDAVRSVRPRPFSRDLPRRPLRVHLPIVFELR
jgi:periplasmic protein TonB